MSSEKFGKIELSCNVSEKKLKDKALTKLIIHHRIYQNIWKKCLQSRLIPLRKPRIEHIRRKKLFSVFHKERNLIEVKELREAKNSTIESVEASLKAFHMKINFITFRF